MYTGNSIDARGKPIIVPSNGMLWSIKMNEEMMNWNKYRVEGSIPPKRYYSSCLI